MDFEFRTFSTRSFERFAQALAMHSLGSGLLVFGDGPDGGREASYDGALNYPSPAEQWSGYTVMQAKFRQIPGTPSQDAGWLVDQMRTELDKFTRAKTKLRKPDYYILVTNARLSSVAAGKRGKGGIAKLDELFASYAPKLGLKGYRIWHLDQISTMLLGAPELRRSFAAWLSTSDVIADLIDAQGREAQAARAAMYRYLSRELRAHRPLRLQQAGHGSDAQTMIEEVFTDLPFTRRDDEHEPEELLLANLLGRSRDCLDRASVTLQLSGQRGRPERLLLLGGPGQGKTTISQFLAQIFRANMLLLDRPGEVSAETAAIVESTLAATHAAGLATQVPRRFPLRVDLPMLADALSTEDQARTPSLLGYLADHISRIGDGKIDTETLRQWIKDHPCILILDGLDEVPPSANRGDVVRAINDFWDEASAADVLMVITTRPQGYNDDLDPALYTKLEMTSLAPEQAVAYARKLAESRIVEPAQRERTLARVEASSKNQVTARLMVSPLQVAILLALIDQRGDAPNDRWSLFEKYFSVVLEREQAKPGPIGETMRRWHRPISALHHRAGFLLHVDAETQGHSEAYLTHEELAELIRGQLSDVDHEGAKLEAITTELLAASTERLVLIVQREEGRYSFEVRSLQEFMAAAYVMAGRDARVQDRLCRIANREHWLHVFQIAASKCFAVPDTEHHRDTIITICRALNENDNPVDKLLRTGSQLALALLDDGLAFGQPKYHRMLVSLALDSVHAGVNALGASLLDHLGHEPARAVEQLRPHLLSPFETTRRAAWTILLRGAALGQDWAEELLAEQWPKDANDMAALFACPVVPAAGSRLEQRLRTAVETASPLAINKALQLSRDEEGIPHLDGLTKRFPCFAIFGHRWIEETSLETSIGGCETPLSIRISKLDSPTKRQSIYANLPETPAWAPIRALRDFDAAPSAAALADLLDEIVVKRWEEEFEMMLQLVPWPLGTAIYHSVRGENLASFARYVRAGGMADVADWRTAEARWSKDGLFEGDLAHASNGRLVDREIARVGMPYGGLSLSHTKYQGPLIDKLLAIGMSARETPRYVLRWIASFALSLYSPEEPLTLAQAQFLFEAGVGRAGDERQSPSLLRSIPFAVLKASALLETINRSGLQSKVYLNNRTEWEEPIVNFLAENLERYPGFIAFLGSMIASEPKGRYFHLIPLSQLKQLEKERHEICSDYATLLMILYDVVCSKTLGKILDRADPFPYALLAQLLSHDALPAPQGHKLSHAIAELANANPALKVDHFYGSIQSVAVRRRADLHDPDCWRRLDLGETLLKQTSRRRER